MLKKLRSFMKDLTIADVVTWGGILVLGLLMFAIVVSLEGCMSYKYDECDYEKTTTTERRLNCPSGKEGGTVIMPGNRP